MKRIFTLVALTAVMSWGSRVMAQSITQAHDTVYLNGSVSSGVQDSLINTTGSSLILEWRVISTDFPSDWLGVTGFCDNPDCFPSSVLWPSGTLKTSDANPPGLMDFRMTFDPTLVSSNSGCHYIRVRFNNKFYPNDTVITTFKVCKSPTRIATVKTTDDVQVYPNPATTEINVVFDANADVKNIAVYNLIGKVVSVYRVNGNSANLSLENEPSGIYFLRLINSNGQVVSTKKFTKQ